MTQNVQDPEDEAVTVTGRFWAEVDLDEQDYLDRLASFGEGYYDFSTLSGEGSGEMSLA